MFASLFSRPAPTAPPAPPAPSPAAVDTIPEVFPGQAKDAQLLFNERLLQEGRALAGGAVEPTEEMRAQVEDLAAAQGAAWTALPVDPEARQGDARGSAIRAELDSLLAAARVAEAETAARADAASAEAAEAGGAAGWVAVPAAALALAAGVAGGLVLAPTVRLLLGDTFTDLVGEHQVLAATTGAALLLGLVPPLTAFVCALARAEPWKFGLAVVFEVGCLAGMAVAREHILGAVPEGVALTAAEAGFLATAAAGRTWLMFSVEAMLVLLANGVGLTVSGALMRGDRRRGLLARADAAGATREAARARTRELEERREADLRKLEGRDVAVHRGEKVTALARALLWQGVMEQTQANWDALHDIPRAVAGLTVVPGGKA